MTSLARLNDISSSRLELVPLAKSDRELFCHLYTDEFLTKNIGGILPRAKAERAFELSLDFNRASSFRRFTWTIIERNNNDRVGICALVACTEDSKSADIGTILLARAHGAGIAKESLNGLMCFGFEKLGLNAIKGYSRFENRISFRLMKSLGFEQDFRIEDQVAGYGWCMSRRYWKAHNNG